MYGKIVRLARYSLAATVGIVVLGQTGTWLKCNRIGKKSQL
jgi:hypothetical protein